MNSRYTATVEDLHRFRDDLLDMNKQIMNKLYHSSISNTHFRVNMLNHNTLNEGILNTILVNSDQAKLKHVPKIDFKEFCLFNQCHNAGLMTVDKDLLDTPIKFFGYDYSKFYYNIMKRIRVPISSPVYTTMDTIDFDKLGYGICRCEVKCSNKHFWNIFNFNKTHHYTHSTLKVLYQYADTYDIRFNLLPADNKYNYNCVQYVDTIELSKLMKNWFEIMDDMLSRCNSWLSKSYVAQAWGNICKTKKITVDKNELNNYDWDHIANTDQNNQYEYYNCKAESGKHSLIKSDDPFNSVLARMKPFLTSYCRNYILNFVSEHELADQVIRIQTDGVAFKRKYNFSKIPYAPILEAKTTGLIIWKNVNSYFHVCKKCTEQYKYDKDIVHECTI